jgi:hypothetical protein
MAEFPPVQTTLIRWAAECSHVIGDTFDAIVKTLQENPIPVEGIQRMLRLISDSCHLSSESALILISNRKLWDAETVLRSVIEGTFKFLYLCLGTPSEIEEKLREYDFDLPNINRLKKHVRIIGFFSAIANPESAEWRPLRDLLLNEDELRELRDMYPKARRRQLEQKWSFHGVTNSLAVAQIPRLEKFKHLFFSYGTASHSVHQDSEGVSMLWERNQRSKERREAVELAHGAREVGDISVMAFIRHFACLHLCGLNTDAALNDYIRQHDLHKERTNAQAYWHDIEYSS